MKHDVKNCETCQAILKELISAMLALHEHTREMARNEKVVMRSHNRDAGEWSGMIE